MLTKPLTKEDVDKINNWSGRLVPLKTYREGKKMQEEVLQNVVQPVVERTELKDVDDTELVRNTLEDLILTHKKKKSTK
jgi:hypothetical protein